MADYPIPPWIRGVSAGELGQLASSSIQSAQRVQLQKQQLSQQQQQFETEMAVKGEIANREALMKQQEMEFQKQYQIAQIGLKHRELEQADQAIKLNTMKAAQQFQAHQKYQQLIEGGMDPTKALLMVGPEMGQSLTGIAALAKTTAPPPTIRPTEGTMASGEHYMTNPRTGSVYFPKASLPDKLSDRDKAQLSDLRRERAEIKKEYSDPMFTAVLQKTEKGKKEYEDAMNQVKSLNDKISRITGGGSSKPKRFVRDANGKFVLAPEEPQSEDQGE